MKNSAHFDFFFFRTVFSLRTSNSPCEGIFNQLVMPLNEKDLVRILLKYAGHVPDLDVADKPKSNNVVKKKSIAVLKSS